MNLDRPGPGRPGAILRDADRQVVDAVAVEIPRRERRAEELALLGGIGAARGELVQEVVGEPGGESTARRAVAHDDRAAAEDRVARESLVERNAGGEIVDAVAVEVPGRHRRAELVAALRNVEQQVLVVERLRADRREPEERELRRGRCGGSEHRDGTGENERPAKGASCTWRSIHADYALRRGGADHAERRLATCSTWWALW